MLSLRMEGFIFNWYLHTWVTRVKLHLTFDVSCYIWLHPYIRFSSTSWAILKFNLVSYKKLWDKSNLIIYSSLYPFFAEDSMACGQWLYISTSYITFILFTIVRNQSLNSSFGSAKTVLLKCQTATMLRAVWFCKISHLLVCHIELGSEPL